MQDFIALQPRREPHALVRTFVVLGLLVSFFTSGLIAIS
jgi:hypothetical protein